MRVITLCLALLLAMVVMVLHTLLPQGCLQLASQTLVVLRQMALQAAMQTLLMRQVPLWDMARMALHTPLTT